ncbi:MAG: polysaccharide export protein [Alphaproteobacteria bacterium]|nr:polysaccharide export protein [Alphaproteobacteria bacterium]MBV9863121.1 polysaccharide export protein [Alphaproteobacteria bacterium]
MMRCFAVSCVAVLALSACSWLPSAGPLKDEVIQQQRRPAGDIAFDVVKIDDRVIATLQAQPHQEFATRFKKYTPPPNLKIAIGDTLSVVIWESASGGLFDLSLTEPLPAAASSRAAGFADGNEGSPTADQTSTSASALGSAPGAAVAPGAAAAAGAAAAGDDALMQALGSVIAQAARDTLAPDQLLELKNQVAQSGRPGTRVPEQQVGGDGRISVPYAGRVPAAGRTPAEVARAIEKRLAGKALDPQVLVVVTESAANSVAVSGEVVSGHRVPLNSGGEKLLQVIAAAGGARGPISETFVRLSRNGVTAAIPLATLVADPQQDIYARPGDVLTLVRRPQTFSVFGAAGKNTAMTFDTERLSLSEALARSGGLLDDQANPAGVFLFRYEPRAVVKALGQPVATAAPDGVSPIAYRLDLSEARSYLLAREFPVRDKDIIFVADSDMQPFYKLFTALSNIVGPVETGLLTCAAAKC